MLQDLFPRVATELINRDISILHIFHSSLLSNVKISMANSEPEQPPHFIQPHYENNLLFFSEMKRDKRKESLKE